MFRNLLASVQSRAERAGAVLGATCLLIAIVAMTVASDASKYVEVTTRNTIASESVSDEPRSEEVSSEEAALGLPAEGGGQSTDFVAGGLGDHVLPDLLAEPQTAAGSRVGPLIGNGQARPATAGDIGAQTGADELAALNSGNGPAAAAVASTSGTTTATQSSSSTAGSSSTSNNVDQTTPATSAATTSTAATSRSAAPTTTAPPASTSATTAAPASTTSAAPATPAPTVPTAQAAIDGYRSNLDMIRAQPVRNRNHDGSPYRNVAQASLDTGNGSPLLGPRSAYLNNPNGNPEQAFPIPAGGQFRIACEFSHFAYDDPLVAPGRPGAAHLHMFFGNTDVNAYSTFQTLRDSGSSTCNGQELNRTGYWAPAMIDGDGNARIPERVVVYYKAEGIARGKVQTYKPGMANISPSGAGVAQVDGGSGGAAGEVEYKCTDNFSGGTFSSGTGSIPNCNGSQYGAGSYPGHRVVLEMEVKFWHCFDPSGAVASTGSWVQAGSGRGHWFYGNCDGSGGGNTGPAYETYPHLSYFINYVVEPGENTSQWYLSSDVDPNTVGGSPRLLSARGATHHADWWGAWHPDINREFVDNCINFADAGGAASGCGFGYLSNGGSNGSSPLGGRALRYRPQYDRPGDSSTIKVPMQTLFAQLCVPLGPAHGYTSPMSGAWCKP